MYEKLSYNDAYKLAVFLEGGEMRDNLMQSTSLDYDYTEEECQKLTSKQLRKGLRVKLEEHISVLWYLTEVLWNDEERCPPIYSEEDVAEVRRQTEWHNNWVKRIEKMLKDGSPAE